MPATSQQQQKLFGLALSVKRGETPRSEASDEVLNIVDTMSEKDIEDFASTSHSGLPKKVESYIRGFVRETFRNKVLGEIVNEAPTRRSKDFFEDDNKYGIELHKLLRGKWDRDKVLQYFIKLQSSAKDKYQNVLYFIANGLGINGRSYKNTVDLRDDIITSIGNLYKLHNESVNKNINEISATQRANTFFKVNTHGHTIYDILKGKWDRKKVENYFNSLVGNNNKEVGYGSWFEELKGTAQSAGVDPYKYIGRKNDLINAIIDTIEEIYKINIKLKIGNKIGLPENLDNSIIESEQLDEKLITFSNRAPYGQVVFIAGGAGCFSSDTKIKTENGYKFIKDIQIGDSVYSYNAETKQTELKPVLEIYSYKLDELPGNQKMLELKFDNGIEIHCTENHEFYIDGKWVMAKNIEMGVEI